jgi:hypothetical protein
MPCTVWTLHDHRILAVKLYLCNNLMAPVSPSPSLQAYLLITKVPDGGGRYNTPPSLILAAWQAYKAAQESSLAAPAPELVQVGAPAGGGPS